MIRNTRHQAMRYTYAYKTRDGQRHEAAMEAASREAVFAALRARGIKPIKVVAADGSKANGEVHGVRKRIFVLCTLCLVLGAIVASIMSFNAGEHSNIQTFQDSNNSFLTDTTRRQVIGDAAVIEKGIRTGWTDVFTREGDRFLASFAIPGVKAGVGTTSIAALEDCLKERSPHRGDPAKNRNDTVRGGRATSMKSPLGIEARQILAMVEGMKAEARAYLAAGGTAVEYGKRLTERQDAEIAIYARVESEILAARKTMEESAFQDFYETRNDELRNLGIRPVTLPE